MLNAVHLVQLNNAHFTTDRLHLSNTSALKDFYKADFHAMNRWFEEDVPIQGHLKDPYKRTDILYSTRNVQVGIDGVTSAKGSSPLRLLETTLRMEIGQVRVRKLQVTGVSTMRRLICGLMGERAALKNWN